MDFRDILELQPYFKVMKSTFVKAFKEVIREQLLENNTVELGDLGRFELVHKKQTQKKYDNGRVVMLPPANVVEFKSDQKQQ